MARKQQVRDVGHVAVPAWVERALASSDYSPALQATIREKVACGELAADDEADFRRLLARAAEEKRRG